HAFDSLAAGETKTLLDLAGSGTVCRIWLTVGDRSPEMLRSLRVDMSWDGAERPAVSAPLGDLFGVSLGRRTPFECALFSDPEGRSFNCFVPMPFRTGARITITNESERRLAHLFYDVDVLTAIQHSEDALYFHAHWRRESPNALGSEFAILPRVRGRGRFLGCNLGVIADAAYAGTWWGEGEVKCRFGGEEYPTLCGTGTEDYIGTGWGQGVYAHRTQGCLIADRERRQWAFYRYHVDDPIYFHDGCEVAIQTIGGCGKAQALDLACKGVPLIPVSIDTAEEGGFVRLLDREPPLDLESPVSPDGWLNFWRQDDWSATAYFYLDSPSGCLPDIASVSDRAAGLSAHAES
ncbi:MAG TPA: glycoside hydrolase family 172 protein, partial [Chthonomonadaceae bacterium]|nr:glycoside hydrolase family 172 protein [Chthonomonadaceae bacterium]